MLGLSMLKVSQKSLQPRTPHLSFLSPQAVLPGTTIYFTSL